jgi:hypothetical protein
VEDVLIILITSAGKKLKSQRGEGKKAERGGGEKAALPCLTDLARLLFFFFFLLFFSRILFFFTGLCFVFFHGSASSPFFFFSLLFFSRTLFFFTGLCFVFFHGKQGGDRGRSNFLDFPFFSYCLSFFFFTFVFFTCQTHTHAETISWEAQVATRDQSVTALFFSVSFSFFFWDVPNSRSRQEAIGEGRMHGARGKNAVPRGVCRGEKNHGLN